MCPAYPEASASIRLLEDSGVPRRPAAPDSAGRYHFVLSRCLGSSTHYSWWLLCGPHLLAHWTVLADDCAGLRQSNLFLLRSPERLIPAARYDQGCCRVVLLLPPNSGAATPRHTVRHALAQGYLVLDLQGQHLRGRYVLQRVGAGRSHTWQLTATDDTAA